MIILGYYYTSANNEPGFFIVYNDPFSHLHEN